MSGSGRAVRQGGESVTEFADFPKLYEDNNLLVYHNRSGGIFIESKHDRNARIRVTPDYPGMHVTAHDGRLIPWIVNGLSAIMVRGGR